MIKEYQSQVYKVFVIVMILLTCTLLCFIYYFSKIRIRDISNEKNIPIETHFFTKDELNISNVLPISDVLGKKIEQKDVEEGIQSIIEFEIINESNQEQSYEIFLTEINKTKSIDGSYIKLYLTDTKDVPFEKFSYEKVPTFNSLSNLDDLSSSKILYSGTIFKKNHQRFRLRMWLSDSYSLNQELNKFGVSVGVRLKEEFYGE